MRNVWVGLISALLLQCIFMVPAAALIPSPDIVISHVVAGETGASHSEFIALYNNSNTDMIMNGYCVWSGSSAASGAIACVQADANTTVYIKAHGYLTLASSSFVSNHTYSPDTVYPAANKITVGGDSVYLQNATGSEIDRVTWGSNKLATGGTLLRAETSTGSGVLADTDSVDTLSDFTVATTTHIPLNASYDVTMIPDTCPNIDGHQSSMPLGMLYDEAGSCQLDSCLNLAGLQASVPIGYDDDAAGICSLHDECLNVDDVQPEIPLYMSKSSEGTCIWDIAPLQLTELLANPAGSDAGNEFIEIYNPNDTIVSLGAYSIKVGVNGEKTHAFPTGSTIGPKEYKSFIDTDLGFTLVNTASRVKLVSIDSIVHTDSGMYESPGDGMAWALFDGGWSFTDQPSPGLPNLALSNEIDGAVVVNSSLAPCAAGKYRHPLTNRCRNIEADIAVIAACDADQYRNPDTGRCRKIVTANVTPCKDGQYRSEETNRCRTITTASALKPCNDNQYRSEETGRCRNVSATTVPDSAFAVQPVKDGTTAFIGWWALGGVSLLAVGYGVWEWRKEIAVILMNATSFFSGKK